MLLVLTAALGEDAAHQIEEALDEVQDIPPIVDEHRNQGAQVEQHVKKQGLLRVGQAKEVLEQGQVA